MNLLVWILKPLLPIYSRFFHTFMQENFKESRLTNCSPLNRPSIKKEQCSVVNNNSLNGCKNYWGQLATDKYLVVQYCNMESGSVPAGQSGCLPLFIDPAGRVLSILPTAKTELLDCIHVKNTAPQQNGLSASLVVWKLTGQLIFFKFLGLGRVVIWSKKS